MISAVVSLHDVAPDTLDACARLIERLRAGGIPTEHVPLLVVPGRDWRTAHLDRLRGWQERGFELAAHGWSHRARCIASLGHRLHAWLLSRDAAEHLALDEEAIARLIARSHRWFADHDLPPPALYVPPAWALGPIAHRRLRALPFRYYEDLWGMLDLAHGRYRKLPLVGFEARSRGRSAPLRLWNGLNVALGADARPVRVALHPGDDQGPLAGSLARILERIRSVSWRSLLE